jgi:Nucleotide modification associated domain 3
MNVALLRVGVDSGCGGIQGPVFATGDFEFIPIPDDRMLDIRTYGNTKGKNGRSLADFFPRGRQARMATQPMHVDPEFDTFTYGDPTSPKRGLRKLQKGDLLVFYAGLAGFGGCTRPPGLFLIGYFEVEIAGLVNTFSPAQISAYFAQNFHVRHASLLAQHQKANDLVLVKGGAGSRLYQKADLFSITLSQTGKSPLKVISLPMRTVFGLFGNKYSFQRSPTRWVEPAYVNSAAKYVRSLT